MNKESRRKFFAKVTKGIAGITLLSIFPIRVFAGNQKENRRIKINIHPDAVKRNK